MSSENLFAPTFIMLEAKLDDENKPTHFRSRMIRPNDIKDIVSVGKRGTLITLEDGTRLRAKNEINDIMEQIRSLKWE